MEPVNRPTREIVTSGGHTIVVNEYVTGREYKRIEAVYIKNARYEMVGKEMIMKGINPEFEEESNQKMLEAVIVSFDGETEGRVDRVLDLPKLEYDEVMEQVDFITGKKKPELSA